MDEQQPFKIFNVYVYMYVIFFFKQEPDPSRVLGVFNLSLRTTERDLQSIFERYGKVNQVTIVYDHRVNINNDFS